MPREGFTTEFTEKKMNREGAKDAKQTIGSQGPAAQLRTSAHGAEAWADAGPQAP